MPKSTGPVELKTTSGSVLPIVALPQQALLAVNEHDIELVDALATQPPNYIEAGFTEATPVGQG
ncbi:hypothetical protein [Actinomycetospora sp. CA-084318]|uniref:hypothetical protein n=1 Tax=Actinomycetospora sp. CA-084318 TaxID=3239892 RepID=UPI003D97F076